MRYLPLYEGKLFHQFDHRWATYRGLEIDKSVGSEVKESTDLETDDPTDLEDEEYEDEDLSEPVEEGKSSKGRKQRPDPVKCSLTQKQDARFLPEPYDWVSEYDVLMRAVPLSREDKKEFERMDPEEAVERLRPRAPKWLIAFRNITNTTNERTAIFTALPLVGAGHSAPVLDVVGKVNNYLCFLSLFDSLVLDWVVRQKLGGTNYTLGYLYQTAIPYLDSSDKETRNRILPLALELVYTSWHLKPLAEEVCRSLGLEACRSFGWELSGFEPFDLAPFPFDEDRRALLRAELDALVARLYGLNRKQLRYILCPQGLSWAELENVNDGWEDPTCSGPHCLPAEPATDFPGETFRVLKENEEANYGEYRTRRLVLEAWDRLWRELGPVEPLPVRFGPNAPTDVSRQAAEDAKGDLAAFEPSREDVSRQAAKDAKGDLAGFAPSRESASSRQAAKDAKGDSAGIAPSRDAERPVTTGLFGEGDSG